VLEMKNCDPDQLSIGPCSHRAVEFGELVRLIAGRLLMSTRFLAAVPLVKFFSQSWACRAKARYWREKYPPGTTLGPIEWGRFIPPLGYLPLPHLSEGMDSFVIRIHMVLPISEMHNGRVEHVEYNFDRHWAMFVDWIARCGDEAEMEWGVRWHGPLIVSSRPFYTPKDTTNVMITDNHTVVSGPPFVRRQTPSRAYTFSSYRTPVTVINSHATERQTHMTPLIFHKGGGVEDDDDGGEYMPLDILRRILQSGTATTFWWSGACPYTMALMDSIDIWQSITRSDTPNECPG
jgi:hypothetical protein